MKDAHHNTSQSEMTLDIQMKMSPSSQTDLETGALKMSQSTKHHSTLTVLPRVNRPRLCKRRLQRRVQPLKKTKCRFRSCHQCSKSTQLHPATGQDDCLAFLLHCTTLPSTSYAGSCQILFLHTQAAAGNVLFSIQSEGPLL